ncbi:MAG TPA: SusD/RagB family nutrient-binding outer membrane lipoprotein, partial [Arachidicoccus sp.]
SYAEVAFDLAEAAQRGWNVGGNAEDFYKKGVIASMTFWGVSNADANTYLKKNPYNAADWRDVIGTQKWLALYNQGLESWFERTRLNFKNPNGQPLFVAPKQSLDPSVTLVPYRLTYPIAEQSNNHTNYEKAIALFPDGRDAKGIRLWWQVN